MQIRTILAPTDFSPHARVAVSYALELAKQFNAELHLFYAYHMPPLVVMPQAVAIPSTFWTELERGAREQIEALRAELDAGNVKVHVRVRDAAPAQAVAEEAENIGADLIVMGTRGLTGLKHILLGSVAERTLRLAPCPVITVRSDME